MADLLDVIGTNYRDLELLDAWKDDPSRKIVCTEQGHDRRRWLDCRDAPQHAGQFLWVGIDYLGESRRWPVTTFDTGLLDRTGLVYPRGMERASWWSEEPVVHLLRRVAPTEATPDDPGYEAEEWLRRRVLCDDWSPASREPHPETVEVTSNCPQVELLLNGKSLGSKPRPADASPRVWNVEFQPGLLEAVGRNGAEILARDSRRTAGPAAALRGTSDRPELTVAWDDVAHVEVEVVDAHGERVPAADPLLRFSLEGPGEIVAVDNGSIVSLEPFQAASRRAFVGRCLAIVRATEESGPIVLKVAAEGLSPLEITLRP